MSLPPDVFHAETAPARVWRCTSLYDRSNSPGILIVSWPVPVECEGQNAGNIRCFFKGLARLVAPKAPQLDPHLKQFWPADDCRTQGKTIGAKIEALPAPKEIYESISETR